MSFGRILLSLAALMLCCTNADAIVTEHLSSFGPGIDGGAEIAAFDPQSRRLFVTNGANNALDVYDISDPRAVLSLPSISLAALGAAPNSVAVMNGLVAVAMEADPAQDLGIVALFDAESAALQGQFTVGALPDMLTFTPDGEYLLVANEGEPNDDYTIDPPGTISIISTGTAARGSLVRTVDFSAFNRGEPRQNELPPGVRIFGPDASVAQDLEPEYIAIDESGAVAYVALQENNALAIIDIVNASVMQIVALGSKNHALPANALDASNQDGGINIRNWPVSGFFQPDAIATLTRDGQVYVFSANEGDARDYDGFSEEFRIRDLTLDPVAFPDAANLQQNENLGRLRTTDQNGDSDNDGDFDRLFSYGARSFSVWSGTSGALLWDSGDEFERETARLGLPLFNADDSRSDDKGPEPEGIDVLRVGDRDLVAIGLERTGGFFLYDVTVPTAPRLVRYISSPDGDVGPEGVLGIEAGDNGDGAPWLVVTHEVSGTIALYRLSGGRAVPVLGYGGLLVLILLLAVTAAVVVRRRDDCQST